MYVCIYMCICACATCVCATCVQVPVEARRGCQRPWSWSYMKVWAGNWTVVLYKAVSTLNCWAIFLVSYYKVSCYVALVRWTQYLDQLGHRLSQTCKHPVHAFQMPRIKPNLLDSSKASWSSGTLSSLLFSLFHFSSILDSQLHSRSICLLSSDSSWNCTGLQHVL